MPTFSHSHNKWIIIFIDDVSGFAALHFLPSKADAVQCFKDLVSGAETQTGYQLKSVCSDQWGEYINDNLWTFLSSRGIEHHTSVPYTPEPNGWVERFNCTICETACFPPSFWQDMVETVLHIYTCQPMHRLGWSPPISRWDGEIPDVLYLEVFGCLAYKEDHQNKLSANAKEATFIGYKKGTKGYCFWSPMHRVTSCLPFLKAMKMKLIRIRILNLKKMYWSINAIHFHLWKINTIPIKKSLQVINSHLMILHILHILLLHVGWCHLLYPNRKEDRELTILGSCHTSCI